MNADFKRCIILLMQHPIMRKPLDTLPRNELADAYDLIGFLENMADDDDYTLFDNIQMARLAYTRGELASVLGWYKNDNLDHYQRAARFLVEGGFDLSITKWTQLVSLCYTESKPTQLNTDK